jgi:hypothetical protein
MSSVKPVAGAEGEVLSKLTKSGRAVLAETAKAVVQIDGRTFYALSTLVLLDLAAAVREAEALGD